MPGLTVNAVHPLRLRLVSSMHATSTTAQSWDGQRTVAIYLSSQKKKMYKWSVCHLHLSGVLDIRDNWARPQVHHVLQNARWHPFAQIPTERSFKVFINSLKILLACCAVSRKLWSPSRRNGYTRSKSSFIPWSVVLLRRAPRNNSITRRCADFLFNFVGVIFLVDFCEWTRINHQITPHTKTHTVGVDNSFYNWLQ